MGGEGNEKLINLEMCRYRSVFFIVPVRPQALEQDPSYWPALESLENVKSLAVDRWHYRMLNHNARNESYSRAIERAVKTAASRPGRSSSVSFMLMITFRRGERSEEGCPHKDTGSAGVALLGEPIITTSCYAFLHYVYILDLYLLY